MSTDLVNFSMEPQTLEEAMKYAEIIAKSDLVPKDYKGNPGNVLIAIQWGREVGLKPLQALQNIAVVNGRPSLYGDAPLALVKNSGLLEDFREDFDEATQTAICSARRKGQPTAISYSFGLDDAKKAGLWGKQGSWQQYPKRMLKMRARGFVLRDGFPDVLKGIAIGEEQEDVVPENGEALPAPPPLPKRLSQREATTKTPSEFDPLAEWEGVLSSAPTLAELKAEWGRLTSKNGLYSILSQAEQARLLSAKNQRKQQLSADGHTDAQPSTEDANQPAGA